MTCLYKTNFLPKVIFKLHNLGDQKDYSFFHKQFISSCKAFFGQDALYSHRPPFIYFLYTWYRRRITKKLQYMLRPKPQFNDQYRTHLYIRLFLLYCFYWAGNLRKTTYSILCIVDLRFIFLLKNCYNHLKNSFILR